MMSKRSTDLYHCTKSNSLINILKTKYFRYSYCLEEFYMHKEDRYSLVKLAYAMVCFADLLEEELSEHMEQFGADSYIVMEKKWAIKNNLSPVIYCSKDGLPNYAYLSLTKNIKEVLRHGTKEEIIVANAIELLRPYFKQYEGHYFINRTDEPSKETVEFFLEREWRSLPFVKGGEHFYLELEEYLNDDFRNKATQELCGHGYRLEFGWDDILRIGCKEEQKDEMIQSVFRSFGVDEKEAESKTIII